MMTSNLRFSWKAIALAPVAVPLIAALLLAMAPSRDPLWSFLFYLGFGGVFSYAATLGLFLPALAVLSCFTRLNLWRTALAGMTLGHLIYIPVAWQSYLASGDNSGPPTETFAAYLGRNILPEGWLFAAGGLVTAALYWLLARR